MISSSSHSDPQDLRSRPGSCRRLLLCASAALLSAAWQAQAVVVFFDTGDTKTGVQGGPIDHGNPVFSAAPGEILTLHVWALPDADDQKTVAALGLDIAASGSAALQMSAVQFLLDNPALPAAGRWDGVHIAGGLNQAGLLVADARAVFVPLESPPAGGIGSGHAPLDPGLDPTTGAIHVGLLEISVDAAAPLGIAAELRFAVGPLTIAQATAGTWSPEAVFFGYDGAGPEAASGTGSEVGATSVTADATVIVAAACDGLADCADADGNGVRDDSCTWWACAASHCAATPVPFADLGGAFGACQPDGTADGNDRFHALNCFANQNSAGTTGYPCEQSPPQAFNVDAGSPFGDCDPDGVCDGHDAFHALNAFGGISTCTCPAGGPQPAPRSRSAPPRLRPPAR